MKHFANLEYGWHRPAAAAAVAAFFVALLLTPLGGYAKSLLTVFEPRQFQPIELSRSDLRDLRLLPQADDVGTQHVVRKPVRQTYGSIEQAQRHLQFSVLRPTTVPAELRAVHVYRTTAPGVMTFTFSAAKARAFEQRSHKMLPAMPRALDGTTVRVQTGQLFEARYEAASARRRDSSRPGSAFLEVIESQAPRITSTGASLDALERYLLAMPNVSPQLAAQIRTLSDIQNTVPIPVLIDKQTARHVTVNGAQGLAVGDNTGLGAGVVWQRNGMIYAVGGPASMDDAMAVANGLR